MKKRMLSLLLAVALVLGLCPGVFAAGSSYADVLDTHWAHPYIEDVTEKGIMNGVGDKNFAPEDAMTRAMFVTVLARLSGDTLTEKTSFSDVPAGQWYSAAVSWAAENGIVLGYHNHAHEFIGGSDYVKGIADAVKGLKLELDVFWLAVAGINALTYMEEEKDRLLFLHIKELGADGADGVNPVVGQGLAQCGAVMEKGKALGVPWAILEAEKIGMAEDKYLSESCKFMKKYQ